MRVSQETASWGLIGPGAVGSEVVRQLEQPIVAERLNMERVPSFILRSSGMYAPDIDDPRDKSRYELMDAKCLDDLDDMPDVVFLAMGTEDDGNTAAGYISHILDRGKMVVTAEKGSVANHFERLRDESEGFARLGINASVGGGTRLMEAAKPYASDPENITQIHLAFNGTLAAIMSSVGSGRTLGQAVDQAVVLGFAEPGAASPQEVIRGEAEGDTPKKTSIFFNKLGLGSLLDWRDLRFDLSDSDIERAVEGADHRRFLVSIYSPMYRERTEHPVENGVIGGVAFDHQDGWLIQSGFRHTNRNPLFKTFTSTTGPDVGCVVALGPNESDGVYQITGPGAGLGPTANTMIDDFGNMRK
ncbi:MAG: hypothetical protein ABIQ89_01110 [Candidatus Saccharimonadales bacterium]